MAKLEYDESLVEEAVNTLSRAKTSVSDTPQTLTSAIGIITGARGANYIDASALQTGVNIADVATQSIDNFTNEIASRVQSIMEYNEDVDSMGFVQRLFGTIGMAGTKVVEGFASGVEQLVDGFASLTGFLIGGAQKIFTGETTIQDSIAEFVEKDHVGDYFHEKYYDENSLLGKMNKASYTKEDGIVNNIFKIGGTVAAYMVAQSAVGGAIGIASGGAYGGAAAGAGASAMFKAGAGAARASLGVNMASAALGSMGSGVQAGLKSGQTYNEAMWTGTKAAATSAVITFGATKLFQALGKWWAGRGTSSAADEVVDDLVSGGNGADDLFTSGGNTPKLGDGGSGATQKMLPKGETQLMLEAGSSVADTADDLFKVGADGLVDMGNNIKLDASVLRKMAESQGMSLDDYLSSLSRGYGGAGGAFADTADDLFKVGADGLVDMGNNIKLDASVLRKMAESQGMSLDDYLSSLSRGYGGAGGASGTFTSGGAGTSGTGGLGGGTSSGGVGPRGGIEISGSAGDGAKAMFGSLDDVSSNIGDDVLGYAKGAVGDSSYLGAAAEFADDGVRVGTKVMDTPIFDLRGQYVEINGEIYEIGSEAAKKAMEKSSTTALQVYADKGVTALTNGAEKGVTALTTTGSNTATTALVSAGKEASKVGTELVADVLDKSGNVIGQTTYKVLDEVGTKAATEVAKKGLTVAVPIISTPIIAPTELPVVKPVEVPALPEHVTSPIEIPDSDPIPVPAPIVTTPVVPSTPVTSPAIPSTPVTSPAIPSTPVTSPAIPSTPVTSPAIPSTPVTSPAIPSTPQSDPVPAPIVTTPVTTPVVPSTPVTTPVEPSTPVTTPVVPSTPVTTPTVPPTPVEPTPVNQTPVNPTPINPVPIPSNPTPTPVTPVVPTPVNPTLPSDPTPVTYPTVPSTPTTVTNPTTPTSVTNPTTPTSVTNPTTPTSVTNPTTPTSVTNPTTPTSVTNPTTPTPVTNPTQPRETDPTHPTPVTNPTNPTNPTDPTNPTPAINPDPNPSMDPGGSGGYVPIPNTGVGKKNDWRNFIVPASVGAVAGITGLAASIRRNKKEDDEDNTDEEYYDRNGYVNTDKIEEYNKNEGFKSYDELENEEII